MNEAYQCRPRAPSAQLRQGVLTVPLKKATSINPRDDYDDIAMRVRSKTNVRVAYQEVSPQYQVVSAERRW